MAKGPTARTLAMRVLQDVERSGGFSNRALSRHLERHPTLDGRDRGLATTLVYGVLRHRARLDAHIDAHATKPRGLKGETRQTLRIATYEMLELQRPAPIAISEALRSLDRAGPLRKAANAILGAVGREGPQLDERWSRGKPLDVLERRWSVPRWMAGRWLKTLGEERAMARAKAIATPPPIDLRVDTTRIELPDAIARLKADHPGITIEQAEPHPQSLRTRGGGDVFYGPMHGEGLVSVQGLAAQQPVRELAPQPGDRILDACAGMGVKTLQLAELMQGRGTIVAADLDPKQIDEANLQMRRGRLGDKTLTMTLVQADLTGDHDLLDAQPFDAVLLDVPCTGLGNLARHPEIRWNRTFDDIGTAAGLQDRLLRRNLARVKPGGALVYAVCSFAPEEGPGVVEPVVSDGMAHLEHARTWTPEDDGTEGFYVARLRLP